MSNLIVVLFLAFASPPESDHEPRPCPLSQKQALLPTGQAGQDNLGNTALWNQNLHADSPITIEPPRVVYPGELTPTWDQRAPFQSTAAIFARRAQQAFGPTALSPPRPKPPTALTSSTLLFSFAGNPPAPGAFPLWKCRKLLSHHIPREAIHTS